MQQYPTDHLQVRLSYESLRNRPRDQYIWVSVSFPSTCRSFLLFFVVAGGSASLLQVAVGRDEEEKLCLKFAALEFLLSFVLCITGRF